MHYSLVTIHPHRGRPPYRGRPARFRPQPEQRPREGTAPPTLIPPRNGPTPLEKERFLLPFKPRASCAKIIPAKDHQGGCHLTDAARPVPDPPPPEKASGDALARRADPPRPDAGGLGIPPAKVPLKYIDDAAAKPRGSRLGALRKDAAVVRGIKDLQQLQKQTVVVLESVKAALENIGEVLRSPEATRGMEKQRNAAALLAKGFPRDAVEQAQGAVALLPANPDSHLLLALSLAADQQFDASLAATRKGLGLFDRRQHPLAIEAGLLHALAALGHGGEAAERWGAIIDTLPAPVLLEHLERIIVCYPSDAPAGQLDGVVRRRVERREAPEKPGRSRHVETRPEEMPAAALLTGLDAAAAGRLPRTHRAILGTLAGRLKAGRDAAAVVKFIVECVLPLGARPELDAAVAALARSAVKRLLRLRADAMMLHRAMTKLDLAGAEQSARDLAGLLNHWRRSGAKARRQRTLLSAALVFVLGGVAAMAWLLWGMGVSQGHSVSLHVAGLGIEAPLLAAGVIGVGMLLGVLGLMGRTYEVQLPAGRGRLTREELKYLRVAAVKASVKGMLRAG